MRNTNTKTCSCCLQAARYSVAVLVSTVGVSPRSQKCSPVIVLCEDCVRELCESAVKTSSELRESLKRAYTALNLLRRDKSASLRTKS
jgi:hypothetical protein